MFTDFGKKNTLGKLVTMATRKCLFLIYEIENFANTEKLPSFKVLACFDVEFWAIYWAGGGKHPTPQCL